MSAVAVVFAVACVVEAAVVVFEVEEVVFAVVLLVGFVEPEGLVVDDVDSESLEEESVAEVSSVEDVDSVLLASVVSEVFSVGEVSSVEDVASVMVVSVVSEVSVVSSV